jgi:gamma-D-glutamyl-L-lysine dipeptidyl-peptidase
MEILRLTRLVAVLGVLIIVAACSSAPRYRGRPSPVDSAPVAGAVHDGGGTARGDDVVKRAADYLGVPYRNGGTTTRGVDCSGLTYAVYGSIGIRLPRTSDDQAHAGSPVPRDDLEPGDLIFFGSGNNVSHVGIYAGDGEFIHASDRARSVRFDRLDNKYFRKRYITARRVL